MSYHFVPDVAVRAPNGLWGAAVPTVGDGHGNFSEVAPFPVRRTGDFREVDAILHDRDRAITSRDCTVTNCEH